MRISDWSSDVCSSDLTSTFARARASRMFTGIITDVGTIDALEQRGDLRVRVRAAYDMAGVDLGASIACSGVCLTVVEKDQGWFAVDVSTEPVRRPAPGSSEGRRVGNEWVGTCRSRWCPYPKK